MADLIQLTNAEIDLVAGGVYQNIYISASQSNSSSVSQSATATNSGAVSATANGNSVGGSLTVAAVGAEATNTALVSQANVIRAANVYRFVY
jgi:hypothetical protein